MVGLCSQASAGVPHQMNYQGFLRESGGHPVSNYVNFQFFIFPDSVGSNACWGPESHTHVQVVDGFFELVLGSLVPISPSCFDGTVRWLEIWVDGAPLSPRKPILSSAYAFRADQAGTASAFVPTGAMLMWLTDVPPAGWLLCDGQTVSRTTYAPLFGVIGTSFGGGDGSTTFNLPDLRGRVPLGKDNMGGLSAGRVTDPSGSALGGAGGEEKHTLSLAEIPAHSHYIDANDKTGGPNGWVVDMNGDALIDRTATTATAGGSGPHNNLQPYLVVNYIVKY
jgi:microcystin-dependent protein